MTPFVPHPLIPTGHMQTVAAILGPMPARPRRTVEKYVPLPDGDQLLLSIDFPTHDDDRKPTILLVHGLGGSGESTYMLRHSYHLGHAGYTVVRFHHRGSGPSHLDQARDIYHSGRTDDLDAALRYLGQLWSGRRIAVIGYSMSGNILLRYLGVGTHAGQAGSGGILPPKYLTNALAICPPIDLETCSKALSSRQNWHINRYLSYHVTKQARALEARRPPDSRMSFPAGLDLRTFDKLYTAPRAGYASREDYYSQCSSKTVLARIAVPTTILAAKDDPIVPASMFCDAKLSPMVKLRLESGGGHMGFISRAVTALGDRRWLDHEVVLWAKNLR